MRDLLISVVHGFSNRKYKTYTPFVSTTPDFKCAKRFAGKATTEEGNPCGIDLFFPSGWMYRVFPSTSLKDASKKLKQLGLPPLNRKFFTENEVLFLGGIFPQQIFAIADLTSKVAIWNPGVFDVPLDAEAEIWRNGFPIDQTDFERLMEQTGYAKGIETSAAGDREIKPKR